MIEKISAAFSEVKDHLHERVSSPLAGAFLLSWCIWNYQLLLVLLGDMTSSDKIYYIENNLYGHGWIDVGMLFIGPSITAMGYILLYPIIGKHFYAYSRKHQNILKDLKQQIDGESLLSEKEAKELRTEVIRAKNKANNAVRDQEHMLNENERLQKEIDALQKQMNEFEGSNINESEVQNFPVSNIESDEENMVQVLRYIGLHDRDYVPRSDVISTFGKDFNKIILDNMLDKLQQSNLIERASGARYVITKSGRTLLVDLDNRAKLEHEK